MHNTKRQRKSKTHSFEIIINCTVIYYTDKHSLMSFLHEIECFFTREIMFAGKERCQSLWHTNIYRMKLLQQKKKAKSE